MNARKPEPRLESARSHSAAVPSWAEGKSLAENPVFFFLGGCLRGLFPCSGAGQCDEGSFVIPVGF